MEDNGAGVCFHVLCFNAQPGVTIDYATGDSWAEGETPPPTGRSPIFSTPVPCASTNQTAPVQPASPPANRQETTANRELLLAQGYQPCGTCKP